LDSDGDGKAYPAEIASFLSHQQAGLRAQIHTRVGDVEDLLFMALDTNNDQRLDSREIQHTAKRLAELDADGDGLLNAIELPETITIVLARGSIENADALFTPSMAALASNAEKAPRWFSSMDANRDGVISRREFLGTNDQFSQLDQNQSGLLELEEVPQRP
jgi:Ca2+-binding EF-hand superfamily protein